MRLKPKSLQGRLLLGILASLTLTLALGGVVAALLMVPFANFLAPVLGAAAAAHLVHRKPRI